MHSGQKTIWREGPVTWLFIFDFTDWRNIMPLKKGTSKATVSSNVKTLVHEWEKDGKIGNSHPASKQKAVKQAVAISLKKAGKSRTQTHAPKK